MPLIGKVLWWDTRDGNGVIADPRGNEYYFDSSVLRSRTLGRLKAGQIVHFEVNSAISHTTCAHEVVIPEAKRRASLKRAFEKEQVDASA